MVAEVIGKPGTFSSSVPNKVDGISRFNEPSPYGKETDSFCLLKVVLTKTVTYETCDSGRSSQLIQPAIESAHTRLAQNGARDSIFMSGLHALEGFSSDVARQRG